MSKDEYFTLLDSDSTKSSTVWVYLGEAEECKECPFRQICHRSLLPYDRFIVVEARDMKYYCKLRDHEVQLFKVRNAGVRLAIETRLAKVGAIVEFSSPLCKIKACPYQEVCMPLELGFKNQKIKIDKIIKKFFCPKDVNRTLALVEAQVV